ncbi:tRNA epoxyqueuosine(34) reductase QueG [Shewanella sp. JM162201]|uniref:Epoxyqueuosine reductase n=1 Tax=Shewanella jiangmenensis TaxID=2837387 RepID=A0ABS5V2A5_9GAMM|nr:tRNA epoxyqueuosine(34) reductase QueG [Shewanella jiangmenensis]MBT1444597.1 tRNA epoxyqueuosine(34) reductase QueG [Shewanella jiangmenensis]
MTTPSPAHPAPGSTHQEATKQEASKEEAPKQEAQAPEPKHPSPQALTELASLIKTWGKSLGFAHIGITDTDLSEHEAPFLDWLEKDYHGEMGYMANHGLMRARPAELHPGTIRVIAARMDYLPEDARFAANLRDPKLGYISRYAGGRDYHKLIRSRLKKLGDMIDEWLKAQGLPDSGSRPFVDSAPILERPLAEKAGIGWTGKHSLILSRGAGSWFFLGELLVNLPLPVDIAVKEECGQCVACIKSCPTGAIVEPYVVDARRCISYLTIELQGAIPEELRPLMGNRIYGCDDCQLACPVNSEAPLSRELDFQTRPALRLPPLIELFDWDEATFLKQTEGSAIRRIGFARWQRNIAVALGNAPSSPDIIARLNARLEDASLDEMVAEHVRWALKRQLAGDGAESRQTARLVRAIEKGMPRDA